jgi:nucleoside-triphosphatase THEP1
MCQKHLPAPGERGAIILVSGWRQVGKTTLLLSLRERALDAGQRVGGFLSVARFEDGAKTGIDLMDAAFGDVIPLAAYGGDGPVRTGHYSFFPAALAAGLRYARAGQAADVFLVDELGPLELVRGDGWAGVIPLVRARAFGVGLVVVRPELVEVARARLGLPPDSALVMVTEANRAAVLSNLLDWLRQWNAG